LDAQIRGIAAATETKRGHEQKSHSNVFRVVSLCISCFLPTPIYLPIGNLFQEGKPGTASQTLPYLSLRLGPSSHDASCTQSTVTSAYLEQLILSIMI
jgi:hypothetical protein